MNRITSKEAKELNQNFVKTRGKVLDKIVQNETGRSNEKDAISSWFSLDDLKEYIAYVEAEGKAKNIDINGLRVYFGAYANKNKKANKKALATVFFVPTTPKVGSLKKDGGFEGEGDGDGGNDVVEIDGMNDGAQGYPPNAQYPQ